MDELKKCPFCGSPGFDFGDIEGVPHAGCSSKGDDCGMPGVMPTAQWNTRSSPAVREEGEIDWESLWDKFSEIVEDDSFTFSGLAGRNIITRDDFDSMVKSLSVPRPVLPTEEEMCRAFTAGVVVGVCGEPPPKEGAFTVWYRQYLKSLSSHTTEEGT